MEKICVQMGSETALDNKGAQVSLIALPSVVPTSVPTTIAKRPISYANHIPNLNPGQNTTPNPNPNPKPEPNIHSNRNPNPNPIFLAKNKPRANINGAFRLFGARREITSTH